MDLKHIGRVTEHFPMKEVTSFKIGGPVDYFIEPETEEELIRALAHDHPGNLFFL